MHLCISVSQSINMHILHLKKKTESPHDDMTLRVIASSLGIAILGSQLTKLTFTFWPSMLLNPDHACKRLGLP